MKTITLLAAAALLAGGCTTIHTVQTDEREGTTIKTETTATAIFSGKAALAGLESTQSENKQGTKMSGLNQDGGEKASDIIRAIFDAGFAAGKAAAIP